MRTYILLLASVFTQAWSARLLSKAGAMRRHQDLGLDDYCSKQTGTFFGKSCVCNDGQVCFRDAAFGCSDGRAEKKTFGEKEIDYQPLCVPDPCMKLGGALWDFEDSRETAQKGWLCQCRGANNYCVDEGGRPCPKVEGLDSSKMFLPPGSGGGCETCTCDVRSKPPEERSDMLVDPVTYCRSQGGQYFGNACVCSGSDVCLKGGAFGCSQDRKKKAAFSNEEISESPVCVPDPCSQFGGRLWDVPHPTNPDQRMWRCECMGGNSYCIDDDQPCPVRPGVEKERHFLPAGAEGGCSTCKCKIMSKPPVKNWAKIFRKTCTEKGGTPFGGSCKCSADHGKGKVCKGIDGEYGCSSSMDSFSMEDCEKNDNDDFICPSCVVDPCDEGHGVLVPANEMDQVGAHRRGWFCSCQKGREESWLCYDAGHQPGCKDEQVAGLSWQLGFPVSCDGCQCMMSTSYSVGGFASLAKQSPGERFIYPSEDLCKHRNAIFSLTASDEIGKPICHCMRPNSCVGDDCVSLTAFEPMDCPACTCSSVICPDPDPGPTTGGLLSWHPRAASPHDDGSTALLHPPRFIPGDRLTMKCSSGYQIQGASTETSCQIVPALPPYGVFSDVPKCEETVSCASPCEECVAPADRLEFPDRICTVCDSEVYLEPVATGGPCIGRISKLTPGRAFGKEDDPDGERAFSVQAPTSLTAAKAKLFKLKDKYDGGKSERSDWFDINCKVAKDFIGRTDLLCEGNYTYLHKHWMRKATPEPRKFQVQVVGGDAGSEAVISVRDANHKAEYGAWEETGTSFSG